MTPTVDRLHQSTAPSLAELEQLRQRPSSELTEWYEGLTGQEQHAVDTAMDDAAIDHLSEFVRAVCSWELGDLRMNAKLKWVAFLDIVCRALERVSRGECRRLVICLPPGHMKSLLVSVLWQAWDWLYRPDRSASCISNDEALATRDSRRLRAIVKSPQYQRLAARASQRFGTPAAGLAKDQNEKANFVNTAGGFREAKSITGNVTGNRYHFGIIDDPIDVKQVVLGSPDQIAVRLKEINDIWDTTLASRFTDAVVVIMQRVAENDLVGHWLLNEEGVEVVCLPQRYDPTHPYRNAADNRDADEILSPATLEATNKGLTAEEADRQMRKRLGERHYAAQAGQRPMPAAGGLFQRSWFGTRYKRSPEEQAVHMDELAISVDAAFKATDTSAYVSIQVWGRKILPKKSMPSLIHAVLERMTYSTMKQCIRDLKARFPGITLILIEDKANGTALIDELSKEFSGVVAYDPTPDGSKYARAQVIVPTWEAGDVALPEKAPWVDGFIEHHVSFPAGVVKDDVDCATQILRRWQAAEGSMNAKDKAKVIGSAFSKAFGM
jgi:predicted phage terminase large subunit-like protein